MLMPVSRTRSHVPGSIFHASTLSQLGGEPQGIHRSMI